MSHKERKAHTATKTQHSQKQINKIIILKSKGQMVSFTERKSVSQALL